MEDVYARSIYHKSIKSIYQRNKSSKIEDEITRSTPKYAPDTILEISHIDLYLEISLYDQRIFGEATYNIVHRRECLLANENERSQIKLNAIDFVRVDVTGENIKSWRYDGHFIDIVWGKCFEGEECREIRIKWEVTTPISGVNFQVPKPDNHYLDQSILAFTDNSDESARYYLPCIDYPNNRSTMNITIIHQVDHECVTSGVWLNTSEVLTFDNIHMKKSEYLVDTPISASQFGFVLGKLNKHFYEASESVKLGYYYTKEIKREDIEKTFSKTLEMIKFVSDVIGIEGDFIKYDYAIIPRARYTSEGSSLSIYPSTLLLEAQTTDELQERSESFIISDIAKSYFGNMVGINYFDSMWLKNGFATYFESLWQGKNDEKDEFDFHMVMAAKRYTEECTAYQRPLAFNKYSSSAQLHDYHGYEGAAWRVHMLERRLGKNVFWSSVKRFLVDNRGTLVDTAMFKRGLEAASGKSLDRFFDEFVYGVGYPRIRCHLQYQPSKGLVQITLDQSSDRIRDYPIVWFGFDIEIELVDSSGGCHREILSFDQNTRALAVIQLPEGTRPSHISIDPNLNMLFTLEFNPGFDLLLNMAERARDVRSRIFAYETAIKSGYPNLLQAVKMRLRNESHYGVRMFAGKSLAKLHSREAHELLSELISTETHPIALAHLFSYCSSISSICLLHSIQSKILDPSLGLHSLSNAYNALGNQKQFDGFDTFSNLLSQRTQTLYTHPLVRRGLFVGISKVPGENQSLGFILDRLENSGLECTRVLPSAINAISLSARTSCSDNRLYTRALELLGSFCFHNDDCIRWAAFDALFQLQAFDKYWLMETAKRRHFSEQLHPMLNSGMLSLLIPQSQQDISALNSMSTLNPLHTVINDLKNKVWDLEVRLEQHNAILNADSESKLNQLRHQSPALSRTIPSNVPIPRPIPTSPSTSASASPSARTSTLTKPKTPSQSQSQSQSQPYQKQSIEHSSSPIPIPMPSPSTKPQVSSNEKNFGNDSLFCFPKSGTQPSKIQVPPSSLKQRRF